MCAQVQADAGVYITGDALVGFTNDDAYSPVAYNFVQNYVVYYARVGGQGGNSYTPINGTLLSEGVPFPALFSLAVEIDARESLIGRC